MLTMSNRVKILLGIITAIPMALGLPVRALEVQIVPKNPQLGDTISVLIEADTQKSLSNPTVMVGEKNYPAFEIAPRQYRSFIPTTPLEKAGVRTIRVSEEGQEQKLSIQVRDRKFPVQRITLPPGKAGVKATQEELKRVAEFKALQTPEKYWNGVFLTPNAGRTSTRYGVRRYYNGVFANDYYHRGQDYAGAAGSSVTAPAAGRVALVGTVSQGFRVHGNVIGIDHGQGVVSIFMHLSSINVQEGDFVKAGQKIGAVGSTGASTGPHLHWGLYVNGQSVDPLPWKSQEIK
ncbi:M23 family metallopeptidase [Dolichospermum planctonicum CS-1226]|uniref:M23 family metallopeptidase n=2 Tax=Dolichospermum planctonicum TaxID=136072 RepID=A0ABT5AIL6_9CYAN|nr:M23 family metallopeptidase [Dolichospermum planctonicum]MDB9537115.1 M23 family metallopeptidase [Dolichospermum planctonicum CS-1226]